MFRQISSRIRLPRNSRDLLNAANLRHGTDGFTSPPKEGVQRIFFALKNPTASAEFEPANLGTKGQHATSRPARPATMYLNFIIPYLYEAQHVSSDTPPIIRSLKLHSQPLVLHTWKVVWTRSWWTLSGTVYCAWQRPPTTCPNNLPRMKNQRLPVQF